MVSTTFEDTRVGLKEHTSVHDHPNGLHNSIFTIYLGRLIIVKAFIVYLAYFESNPVRERDRVVRAPDLKHDPEAARSSPALTT